MPGRSLTTPDAGTRGVLRGFEILKAIAQHQEGATFTKLRSDLRLPKATLHRLLRLLEQERYLSHRSGAYFLGPESTRLAGLLGRASHAGEFPASITPVAEWLAQESGETVVVAVLNEAKTHVVYVHVINSEAPLRIAVPVGNRRPLYSAASGKMLLAYLPEDVQQRYLAETSFEQVTPHTSTKDDMPAILAEARQCGLASDVNGSFLGVGGLASPGFGADSAIHCTISIVGPLERMIADDERLRRLTIDAGERMSRILGYLDAYPPID